MPTERIKSKSPFVVVDNQGTRQEIKVVEIGSLSEPLIAGYSYVEATGSTYDILSGSNKLLQDIVVNTDRKLPSSLNKKRISNVTYNEKTNIINWESESSGSFRICCYDPDRKNMIIYNDSEKDLFISLNNDYNPSITIDYDDTVSIENIKLKFSYNSASVEQSLFEYNYSNIIGYYADFAFGDTPSIRRGAGIETRKAINTINQKKQLILYLTADYLPRSLNRLADSDSTSSLSLVYDNGINPPNAVAFNIIKNSINNNRSYSIYTSLSNNTFSSNTINLSTIDVNSRNGFDLRFSILDKENVAPEDYSYIVYSNEAISIDGPEVTFPMFGYMLKPKINETIQETTIRVLEAK